MTILAEILRDVEVGDSIRLDVFRLGERPRLQYEVPERPLLPTDLTGRLGAPDATDTDLQ